MERLITYLLSIAMFSAATSVAADAPVCYPDCAHAELRGLNFGAEDLRGVDFRWANLEGSVFYRADLSGADLRWSHIGGTSFRNADLHNADLRWARAGLSNDTSTSFEDADLSGADLRWFCVAYQEPYYTMVGADLTNAKGCNQPVSAS